MFWAAALIATLKGGLGKLPIAGRKRGKHVDYNVTRSAFDQDLVRDTGYIKQRRGYKKCPLKAKQIETLFRYFAVAPGGPFDGSGALWRNTLTISLGKNVDGGLLDTIEKQLAEWNEATDGFKNKHAITASERTIYKLGQKIGRAHV